MRPVLSAYVGLVGVPGAGSDLWLHPGVLATATGLRLGRELQVVRMVYPLGDRRFRVIRFQGRSGSWNFEESTGIMLRSTSSGETTVMIPPAGEHGVPQQTTGGSFLAQNTLLDSRLVDLPWANAPAPSWVREVRQLRYDGTWTMHVPGSPVIPLRLFSTLNRDYLGGNWARYVQHIVQPAGPGFPPFESASVRVFGPAQLGGLWIHPAALARLRPGQVLDRDPITRMVTTVGQTVGSMVTLSEVGDVNRLDYGYDRRTGMLVFSRSIDQILRVVTEMRLSSAR